MMSPVTSDPARYIMTVFLSMAFLSSCTGPNKGSAEQATQEVLVVGAMRNVMKKGKVEGQLELSTLRDRDGLYGLGPAHLLRGELLVEDGQIYLSRVASDTTMSLEKTDQISAPFFVYARVSEWDQQILPEQIESLRDLEAYLDETVTTDHRPFCFRLEGSVGRAQIHVQNLPLGARVRSPADAHQGQVRYQLASEDVRILGFFSTAHQGIFTHHDTYLHLHLITSDERMMGHVDSLEVEDMVLYLPKY